MLAINVKLPGWAAEFLAEAAPGRAGDEDRMRLVILLSRLNVEHGTGGPFGAAVFEAGTGRLVSVGVNLVVPSGLSVAHAEIVALSLAQRITGCYDLSGRGETAFELVSSTEPCAMCLGAVPWSGVKRLVCGAREEDAAAAGFDEGDKLADWAGALAARGIDVVRDVCRSDAAAVLKRYAETGGTIYNGRRT